MCNFVYRNVRDWSCQFCLKLDTRDGIIRLFGVRTSVSHALSLVVFVSVVAAGWMDGCV